LLFVTALDGDWLFGFPRWQRCHLSVWQRCHGDHRPVARQKLDAWQQLRRPAPALATAHFRQRPAGV